MVIHYSVKQHLLANVNVVIKQRILPFQTRNIINIFTTRCIVNLETASQRNGWLGATALASCYIITFVCEITFSVGFETVKIAAASERKIIFKMHVFTHADENLIYSMYKTYWPMDFSAVALPSANTAVWLVSVIAKSCFLKSGEYNCWWVMTATGWQMQKTCG